MVQVTSNYTTQINLPLVPREYYNLQAANNYLHLAIVYVLWYLAQQYNWWQPGGEHLLYSTCWHGISPLKNWRTLNNGRPRLWDVTTEPRQDDWHDMIPPLNLLSGFLFAQLQIVWKESCFLLFRSPQHPNLSWYQKISMLLICYLAILSSSVHLNKNCLQLPGI